MGFTAFTGRPHVMEGPHRHDEIEVNYLFQGSVTYLFAGRLVTLKAQQLTLFWAALPHQIVRMQPRTRMAWVLVPLTWLLRWELPSPFATPLLQGRVFSDDASPPEVDEALLTRWAWDMSRRDEALRRIVALEVEARLRRLALQPRRSRRSVESPTLDDDRITHVQQMARHIAEHYREALAVQTVAAAAGLHPNYAMTLFRRTTGMSMVDYITRQRVAHAQRLLATTARPILEIALHSGFGSASRFYEAFGRACGKSPRAYRSALRRGLAV